MKVVEVEETCETFSSVPVDIAAVAVAVAGSDGDVCSAVEMGQMKRTWQVVVVYGASFDDDDDSMCLYCSNS